MSQDLMQSLIMSAPSNDELFRLHRKFETSEVGAWKDNVVTLDARVKRSDMPWTLNFYPLVVSTANHVTTASGYDCYGVWHIAFWTRKGGRITGEVRKATEAEVRTLGMLSGGTFVLSTEE